MKYEILIENDEKDCEIITVTSKAKAFKIAKIIGYDVRCIIRAVHDGYATLVYDNIAVLNIIEEMDDIISKTIATECK